MSKREKMKEDSSKVFRKISNLLIFATFLIVMSLVTLMNPTKAYAEQIKTKTFYIYNLYSGCGISVYNIKDSDSSYAEGWDHGGSIGVTWKYETNGTWTATITMNEANVTSYTPYLKITAGTVTGYHPSGWTVGADTGHGTVGYSGPEHEVHNQADAWDNNNQCSFYIGMGYSRESVTCNWSPNKYKLTIGWGGNDVKRPSGGEGKTEWPNYFTYDWKPGQLFGGNQPTRDGYTFTGWYCGSVKLFGTDGNAVGDAWVSNGTKVLQWSDSSGKYKWLGDTYVEPRWVKNKVLTLKASDPDAVKSATTDKANYSPGTNAKSTVELNYGYHFVSYSGTTVYGKNDGLWKANGSNFPSDYWTMNCDRTININTAKNDYTITFKKGDHVSSFTSSDGETSVTAPYLTDIKSKASADTGYHLTKYSGTSVNDSSKTDTWDSCKGMSSQDNSWTATRDRTITVFAEANTYYVKYNKGSTNNGGSVDTTTHTYDSDVTLASNGFTGMSYSLSFDENKPTDDWGQETDGSVSNLETTKSGNLGFVCWYITDADNNNKTCASAATNLGAKNYRTDNGGTATATAQWGSKVLNKYSTPSLKGYKFNGYYTSASGGTKTTSVQVDPSTSEYSKTLYAQWTPITYKVKYHGNQNWNTSQGDYTQEITYDKHTALTDNKFTRNNNTMYDGVLYKAGYEFMGWGTSPDQKTPTYKDGETVFNLTATDGEVINLYAIWKKTVNLTFDFNGGQYDSNASNKVLTYDMYNSEFNHTFDIASLYGKFKGGNTYQKVYDEKGLNNNLTYTKSGTLQRFLGYSLNSGASIPASQFDVFKASRAADYTIIDNTTLYAIWEPVLEVKAKISSSANVTDIISSSTDIPITTSLGQFTIKGGINSSTLKDSTNTIDYVKNIKGMVTNECTVWYDISAKGRDNITFKMGTDSRILDIYNNGDSDSKWKDSLNDSTVFDRNINNFKSIKSSLVVPQYIGTVQSYNTSNPKFAENTKIYAIRYELSQPSYYYGKYFDTDERVTINAILFLKPGADPNKLPENNTNIETLDGVQTIMDR